MPPRRMDRWWLIGIAFVAAAAMVLLVLLTTGDQAGATAFTPHTTSHAVTHTQHVKAVTSGR